MFPVIDEAEAYTIEFILVRKVIRMPGKGVDCGKGLFLPAVEERQEHGKIFVMVPGQEAAVPCRGFRAPVSSVKQVQVLSPWSGTCAVSGFLSRSKHVIMYSRNRAI